MNCPIRVHNITCNYKRPIMKSTDPVWLIDDDRIDIMTIQGAFATLNISNPVLTFFSASDDHFF